MPTNTGAYEYAKRRLSAFLAGRPLDELKDAQLAYSILAATGDDNARGLADYIGDMIQERKAKTA